MKRSFLNWAKPCAVALLLEALCVSGCNNSSDDIIDIGGGSENNGNQGNVQDPDDLQNPDLNPEEEICTLYFYPNAPEGSPEAETLEPKAVTVNAGAYYTLPEEPVFSVEGYYFLGWTESLDHLYSQYNPGEEIWIPSELNVPDTFILYAVWADTTYINGLRIYKDMVVGYVRDELPADVVIPDGVTAIGWRAFLTDDYPCQIRSVTIPGSVKIIENEAFSNCPNLEKVVIKEGQLSEIGYYTFFWCELLKSVELPDNVKVIGKEAFEHCPKLESITMNGVERIEESAFSGSGLKSVNLPNTLKFIGDYAFWGCDFKSVTIPDSVSVENIGEGVFDGCEKLKKAVLPDGWDEIKYCMFYSCESLEDVNLPSALKIIGEQAFFNCGFTEIVLPEGVTEIGNHAFYNCKNLAKVNLDNVKKIGGRAFYDSPLSEIIIPDGVELLLCKYDNFPFTFSLTPNTRTVSLPASVINEYMNSWACFWNVFSYSDIHRLPYQDYPEEYYVDYTKIDVILREGATSIPQEFLWNGAGGQFKSIVIPNSMKKIGEGAFAYTGFETITMPAGMIVENGAFYATCADIINYGGKKSEWEEWIKYIDIEVGGNNSFTEAKIICTDGTIEPTRERPHKPQR